MIKNEIKAMLKTVSKNNNLNLNNKDIMEFWNNAQFIEIENKTLSEMTKAELKIFKELLNAYLEGKFTFNLRKYKL